MSALPPKADIPICLFGARQWPDLWARLHHSSATGSSRQNGIAARLVGTLRAWVRRAVQLSDSIVAIPILAELHHQCLWIWFLERTGPAVL